MPAVPSAASLALLLGLSFFLGLAFEEVSTRTGERRPGGIRTFPVLALAGGMLYLLDPARLLPFTAGLFILGGWLFAYYRHQLDERDAEGLPTVELMAPILNLHAYLLGAVTLSLPHWVAVGTTVAVVLLFSLRQRLHDLARQIEMKEIVTAGQFLLLTGLVLPLLPTVAVTALTSITPHQAWLALLAVCTLSYASYLVQRFFAPSVGDLGMAVLGGLYSSTATTVVLARQAKAEPSTLLWARAGMTLATGIMYLRVLAIVAVFNRPLAQSLAPSLIGLSILGIGVAALQYRRARPIAPELKHEAVVRNPLELGTAAVFAALFIIVSIVSAWVGSTFGSDGLYTLAAVVGVADIDPFVLNLAQGGVTALPVATLAGAILIATASNNLLKAGYAAAFAGWRASLPCVGTLLLLAAVGVVLAFVTGGA